MSLSREEYQHVKRIFLEARDYDPQEKRALFLRLPPLSEEARGHLKRLLFQEEVPDSVFSSPVLGPQFTVPPPDDLAGDIPEPSEQKTVGKYRILGNLDEGGMGIVYLAEQEHPRRKVAIKVLHGLSVTPSMTRRIEHEAQILGSLQHPGIAQIFEASTTESRWGPQPFIAMEYVAGQAVTDYANEHSLTVPERLKLMIAISHAVHYAHERDVIHRDLKPANILVNEQGHPKIIDFGIARYPELEASLDESRPGSFMGTLAYMSPEQNGHGVVDARSDVYSLGVILFELLTGRIPYAIDGLSFTHALQWIAQSEPQALGDYDMSLRGDLEALVRCALSKDPAQRYASAQDLAHDLENFLASRPLAACPGSIFHRTRLFGRRHRLGVGASMVGACLALVGALVTTQQAFRADKAIEERDHSIQTSQEAHRRADVVSDFLLQLLSKEIPSQVPVQTLPDVLAGVSERVEASFAREPQLKATVRATLAETYLGLGEFRRAEDEARQALSLAGGIGDEWHPLLLEIENLLGRVLVHLGNYEQAEPFFQKILKSKGVTGLKSEPYVRTFFDLIAMLQVLGRLEEAEALTARVLSEFDAGAPLSLRARASVLAQRREHERAESLYRSALEGCRRLFGAEDRRTLGTQSDLGILLSERAESYEEACDLVEDTWRAYDEQFGEEHPSTILGLHNLGSVFLLGGEYKRARELLTQALALKSRILGEAHPGTLITVNNLAGTEYYIGDFEGARKRYLLAIEMARGHLPPHHQTLVILNCNLARVYRAILQPDLAVALLEGTLDEHREALGDTHPDILDIVTELGLCMIDQGQQQEAETLLEEAYQIRLDSLGEEHRATLRAQHDLALAIEAQGRLEEAYDILQEVLELSELALGECDPETIETFCSLGWTASRLGRRDEARTYFREALDRIEFGQVGADIAIQTLLRFSELLRRFRDYAEAEALCREAVALGGSGVVHTYYVVTEAKELLARLLCDQGKHLEAVPYFAECLRVRGFQLGLEHRVTVKLMDDLIESMRASNQFEEAAKLARLTLAVRRKVSGDKHPKSLLALSLVGALAHERGRFEEAAKIHEGTIEMASRFLPTHRELLAFFQDRWATSLASLERYDEAIEALESCLAIQKEVLGNRSQEALRTLQKIRGYERASKH